MTERVVVSLHVRLAEPGSEYLRRALIVKKRAEALGATLAAWGPDAVAFDFAPEEIEEAIDLALATFDDAPSPQVRFSAGVAFGALTRIGTTGSLAMLAWGPPLVTAHTLARAAEPGEVLLDAASPVHLRHTLRMHGEHPVEGLALPALVLDTKQPFRRDTLVDGLHHESESKVLVTVPPLPPLPPLLGLTRDLYERAPQARERRPTDPPPTLRTDPDQDFPRSSSAAGPSATPSSGQGPVGPIESPSSGSGPIGSIENPSSKPGPIGASENPSSENPSSANDGLADAAAFAASSEEPGEEDATPSELPASVDPTSDDALARSVVPPARLPPVRMAPSVPPPGFMGDPGSVPPLAASRISWPGTSEEYVELAAAARQALLKGNVSELERLSDELKTRGDHDDLAERMAGFVAWNRGAKAEGLRKLRAAADAETRPAHRVRALLAYGVALAASGRTDAALLAALGAIARAREVSDRQGEHVCARFLARLSAASGYQRAAHTWAQIAEEVSSPRAE